MDDKNKIDYKEHEMRKLKAIVICYFCYYINQNTHECDGCYEPIYAPRTKICSAFTLRRVGDVDEIEEFIHKSNALRQIFTIGQIRRIANDTPESFINSLNPQEKQAIELITHLYPESLGEKVFCALAKFLNGCLERGQYCLEVYERERELKKVI